MRNFVTKKVHATDPNEVQWAFVDVESRLQELELRIATLEATIREMAVRHDREDTLRAEWSERGLD